MFLTFHRNLSLASVLVAIAIRVFISDTDLGNKGSCFCHLPNLWSNWFMACFCHLQPNQGGRWQKHEPVAPQIRLKDNQTIQQIRNMWPDSNWPNHPSGFLDGMDAGTCHKRSCSCWSQDILKALCAAALNISVSWRDSERFADGPMCRFAHGQIRTCTDVQIFKCTNV